MKQYICPPKLNSKFLLFAWTVPEVIVIMTCLIGGFYVDMILAAASLCILICTARLDGEHSLAGKIWKRILFYYRAKTYRIME